MILNTLQWNRHKDAIELENKTDAESLSEMQRINEKFEELTDRLNVLLGNTLVN